MQKTPMLQFFLQVCPLSASLLADLITVISFLTDERPFKHG